MQGWSDLAETQLTNDKMNETNQLSGHLLVATPSLGDPNFRRAVVLVLDHDDEGVLGVVLNRQSPVSVASLLPQWEQATADPPAMFLGGPVEQEAVLTLGRSKDPELLPGWRRVLADVGMVDLGDSPTEVGSAGLVLRFFAGYAGWGPGQLEQEVESGAWFVVAAAPDDVFSPYPEELWRRVLMRQGGVFRTISEDPSWN